MTCGKMGQSFDEIAYIALQQIQSCSRLPAGRAKHCKIERVLGAEVVENIGLAYLGLRGDGAHGNGIEPLLGKQCLSGGQNSVNAAGVGDFFKYFCGLHGQFSY